MSENFDVICTGEGETHALVDVDEMRRWRQEKKSRGFVEKLMSAKEAVSCFVNHGDYVGIGGFGHVRVPMALIYEIVRQQKRGLRISGHTAVHDLDILMAGGCVTYVDVAYSFGYETRGLSHVGRRLVEAGEIRTSEWTNAALSWRLRAGAMGVPFMPVRIMMGTDTFKRSGAKIVKCPFSGKVVCLLPALNPDVALIHVHKADVFGNCIIEATTVKDIDLARASKRVIVTAEEILDVEEIRAHPERTTIPYFCVDAVVHVPWGSHPGNMPGKYFFDEEHISMYLEMSRSEEGTRDYLEKYVYGVSDFNEYLDLIGRERLSELHKMEVME